MALITYWGRTSRTKSLYSYFKTEHAEMYSYPLVIVYSSSFCPIMILFIGNIPLTLKYSWEQLSKKYSHLLHPPQKI